MSLQQARENALPQSVHVSFDRMKLKAFLKIDPEVAEEAESSSVGQIVSGLGAMGIEGIDAEAVAALLNDIGAGKSVAVAEGVCPQRGKDGAIQYHFDIHRERSAVHGECSGRVDHRELDLIQNVKEGDTLATATPSEPGIPGRNVLGEEMPALPGKPAQIRCGRGVRLEENGLKAVAIHDGMVTLDGDRIVVLSVYTVRGDVDYETGNIRFRGDVVVGRHVNEDFKVESTGNVQVYGNVDKADIDVGGSVEVSGGILGKNSVAVRAQGDIAAGFADNANVVAGGTVLVRGEVFWSCIQAKKVMVEGVKGAVIGGTIRASQEIKVTNAGNPKSAPKTVLEIGPDPTIGEQFENAKAEREELKKSSEKTGELHAQFVKLKERNRGVLTDKGERTLRELCDKMRDAEAREREIAAQIEELNAEMTEVEDCKITIADKAFPGTRIIIHGAVLDINDTVTRATFTNQNGTIVVRV